MQKHRCCALQKAPLLHTHALHESVLGQWQAVQDSEVPWILEALLERKHTSGTNTTPSTSQGAAAVSPELLSLKDTASGLQEGYVQSEIKRQSCSYTSLS